MKKIYHVKAITKDDDEVAELADLGLEIEIDENGCQLSLEFVVEMSEEEIGKLRAHPAVFEISVAV